MAGSPAVLPCATSKASENGFDFGCEPGSAQCPCPATPGEKQEFTLSYAEYEFSGAPTKKMTMAASILSAVALVAMSFF
jgi:hypothetical protein